MKKQHFSRHQICVIGFFFSAVTPAASGGQPMQIYYMYKDGIAVSNSTLALLLNLTSMQICTIGIALVSLIFNHQYMNKLLIIFFIIGIALNSTALILLLIGLFSKRLSKWLIDFAIKVLKYYIVKILVLCMSNMLHYNMLKIVLMLFLKFLTLIIYYALHIWLLLDI